MKNRQYEIALLKFMLDNRVTSWVDLYFQLLKIKHGGTIPTEALEGEWTHDDVLDLAEQMIVLEPQTTIPTPQQIAEHNTL